VKLVKYALAVFVLRVMMNAAWQTAVYPEDGMLLRQDVICVAIVAQRPLEEENYHVQY
jgi:hypothetical protein